MELDGFAEVCERLFRCFALTGNVDLKALRNVPVTLAGVAGGQFAFQERNRLPWLVF
jgi:hypothetical protein